MRQNAKNAKNAAVGSARPAAAVHAPPAARRRARGAWERTGRRGKKRRVVGAYTEPWERTPCRAAHAESRPRVGRPRAVRAGPCPASRAIILYLLFIYEWELLIKTTLPHLSNSTGLSVATLNTFKLNFLLQILCPLIASSMNGSN